MSIPNVPQASGYGLHLSFRRYDILKDKGSVSRAQALKKASEQYEIFNKTQKIDSDFDKAVKELLTENIQ